MVMVSITVIGAIFPSESFLHKRNWNKNPRNNDPFNESRIKVINPVVMMSWHVWKGEEITTYLTVIAVLIANGATGFELAADMIRVE